MAVLAEFEKWYQILHDQQIQHKPAVQFWFNKILKEQWLIMISVYYVSV